MSAQPGSPDAGLVAAQAAPSQEKPVDAAAPPATAPATGATDLEKKVEELNINDGDKKVEAGEAPAAPPAAPVAEEKTTEPTAVALEDKKLDDAPAAVAPSTSGPTWPETGPEHPLTTFFNDLPELTKEAAHSEIWGIQLSADNAFHTKLILQKFLRANQNDLAKAKHQLSETLKWRKEFDPVAAAQATYEKDVFEGLGYIIEAEGVPESANEKDVVTFNIYGAVKDNKKTFGDLDRFLKWRVGLMERSVQKLNLASATKPIPDYGQGPDPYQGVQIHDYLQVSFIRQDPVVKTATNKVIKTLGDYYPETLSRKFFVNVPAIMGWVFSAVKLVISKETARKFTVLSYGDQLAVELGKNIPKEYGGDRAELKEVGEGMALQ
ncbi:CRAL/TRIO domain-containing protein [Aaosphaeria arxii CBS 175.79]|uniref:Phosphatidylinositol transfer protein SFH5 n=1 Tax=Aaosphaeria arxii CBS 175.79 TaxID=1450172 RepID=A0A6A5Y4C1_9PLEO|nr:CRAL/TRIO domain-containing protein [Aaosphaeria arxii CBS 175.79]KAF2019731.1 CRAL/TRIO domain-containing protein [Aaosphaeria arxii CBS 175.79]